MEKEKHKFDRVDEYWRETMVLFKKEERIWDAIDSEKIRNELTNYNKILD